MKARQEQAVVKKKAEIKENHEEKGGRMPA